MSQSVYSKICSLRRMPNTNYSRKIIVAYINKQEISIQYTNTDSFKSILDRLIQFYNNKIGIIIRFIRSSIIKRKYNLILSKYCKLTFRLAPINDYRDLIVIKTTFEPIERQLINTRNLIDNDDIRNFNHEIVFVCRDNGSLYSFDLRELNKITNGMNPFTNKKFSQFNQSLIKLRLRQCPSRLLEIEEIMIDDIDIKINTLVSILESNCGIYIDINRFKKFKNENFRLLIVNLMKNSLVIQILNDEQKKISIKSGTDPQYKNQCVDLLLYIAQHQDGYQNERCLLISDLIQRGDPQISDINHHSSQLDNFFSELYHTIYSQSNRLTSLLPLSPLVDYIDSDTDNEDSNESDISIQIDESYFDLEENPWDFFNPVVPMNNPNISPMPLQSSENASKKRKSKDNQENDNEDNKEGQTKRQKKQ